MKVKEKMIGAEEGDQMFKSYIKQLGVAAGLSVPEVRM